MDVCELVIGSTLFITLYDRPDLVSAMLDLICDTYTAFLEAWFQIHPSRLEGNTHWGFFHCGAIMLRDDSAMNLSTRMVQEFVLPYDQRLLNRFGGGAVHFCGKGDHYIDYLTQLKGVHAINLTQPEYNEMEKIFRNTIDRGINLLALSRHAAETAQDQGRDLRGRVHISV
jgi:uroporphyrinogen-III decarboxylase